MKDKNRKTVEITGIPIDNISMGEAVETVTHFLKEGGVHTIYTPNAEIMMAASRDPYLKSILLQGDMVIADGAGVVLASKILGRSVPEKVSGIDLVKNIFTSGQERKIRFFFFGSKPQVAEQARDNLLEVYPDIQVVGCRNGYFSKEDENEIIEHINSTSVDILLVALGAPKQEMWIHEHKDLLKVKVCIGVGGSLDVFAGKVRLAPESMRRMGLEWLYRLYREPRRFKRMLDLPKYMLYVFSTKLRGN